MSAKRINFGSEFGKRFSPMSLLVISRCFFDLGLKYYVFWSVLQYDTVHLLTAATQSRKASMSTISFTASVVKTNGESSWTQTESSIRIPIPLKCAGHRSSSGT